MNILVIVLALSLPFIIFVSHDSSSVEIYNAAGFNCILIDPLYGLRQQNDEACGVAILRYILMLVDKNISEIDIESAIAKSQDLSFLDLILFLSTENIQAIGYSVNWTFHKRNDVFGVYRINGNHFILHVRRISYFECLYFDPAYGLIIIKDKFLREHWSGEYLEIYI